jgi:excinuclease ABC subunit C
MIKSVIKEIPGIGRVRQKELLKHFGNVENILKASPEVLAKAPKMNEKLAQKVYTFFRTSRDSGQ